MKFLSLFSHMLGFLVGFILMDKYYSRFNAWLWNRKWERDLKRRKKLEAWVRDNSK